MSVLSFSYVYLLISQLTPVKSSWHAHMYLPTLSVHVAPFMHGLLEHSSISENIHKHKSKGKIWTSFICYFSYEILYIIIFKIYNQITFIQRNLFSADFEVYMWHKSVNLSLYDCWFGETTLPALSAMLELHRIEILFEHQWKHSKLQWKTNAKISCLGNSSPVSAIPGLYTTNLLSSIMYNRLLFTA